MIVQADKGNRFVVSTLESFERQGDVHTLKDRKITQDEKEQTQSRMNNVARSLSKIFNLGKNWGDKNSTRCWNNMSTEACLSPTMYPSPKVHKLPDGNGDPKTRPVVQANTCITSRPGEIIADVLEACLQSLPEDKECQSTEEMLVKINQAAIVIKKDA